jgi:hypothetical protein
MVLGLHELSEFAQKFLGVISEERIYKLADLERTDERRERRVWVEDHGCTYVRFGRTHSKGYAFGIYSLECDGSPLRVEIDPSSNRSKVILSAGVRVDGYDVFWGDADGNLVQERVLFDSDFGKVRSEVERLARLQEQ